MFVGGVLSTGGGVVGGGVVPGGGVVLGGGVVPVGGGVLGGGVVPPLSAVNGSSPRTQPASCEPKASVATRTPMTRAARARTRTVLL
jgi:hypothetical protein